MTAFLGSVERRFSVPAIVIATVARQPDRGRCDIMRRVGPHLDPAWAAFLFDGQAQDARTRAGGATQHTRLSYDTRDRLPTEPLLD